MNAKQFDSISFVPVNRKFFQHPFWKEERTFSKAEAWLDLVQAARFEDSTATELIGGQLVSWTRGQLPGSLRYLGDRWDWDKNKVDRFLQFLEKQKMITRHICNGQTIIELTNFATYNTKGQKTGQGKGQQTPSESNGSTDEQDTKRDSQRDTGGTAAGQPRDKTNTVNTVKKEEDISSGADAPAPKKSFKKFSEEEFIKEVWQYEGKYGGAMLMAFFKYWKEKSASGKMKFQLQDTWETELRLENWARRNLNANGHEKFQSNSARNGAVSTVGRQIDFDNP